MGRGRALLGAGLAVLFLGVPLLAGSYFEARRAEDIAMLAERAARDVAAKARDAVALQREAMALVAENTASSPRLRAALRGRVDQNTLSDLFASESWWEPYRSWTTAISYQDDEVIFAEKGEPGAPSFGAIVSTVRARNEPSTEVQAGQRRAFMVTARPVALGTGHKPAVLVLAKPLDNAALLALADRTGGSLLVSDGRRSLGAEGDGDAFTLEAAVGHEEAASFRMGDPAWSAVAMPLSTDLWLWASGRVPAAAVQKLSTGVGATYALWAGAIIFSALSLLWGWRGVGARAPALEPPRTSTSPGLPPSSSHMGVPVAIPTGNSTPITVAMDPSPSSSNPMGVPALAPSTIGQYLGRYLLVDRIAEGGMAELFTAVSVGAGGFRRIFVVKRLRPEMAANRQAVSHFIDEANLAASLVHPNIVPVFDFGEVNGSYYLAQEYVAGRDIGRLILRMWERGLPPPSPRAIMFIGHEVLAGLDYAHNRCDTDDSPLALVHRDVAPGNVLVSSRGEVKVLDFGIVKVNQGRLTKTDIGIVKGNVDFMAPEQARGRAVDQRTDLFGLGLLLYYCATGQTLYDGDTTFERLTRAAHGPTADDLGKIAGLPEPLPEIIARAVAPDPAQRYQTAAEMRAILAPHVEGGQAELATLVQRSFAADLKQEKDRLATVMPRTSGSREVVVAPAKG